MAGEEIKKSIGDVSEIFPFMSSFPFDEYEFELEILEKSNSSSGINPIIIEQAGKFVGPSIINFHTIGELTNISISFYTYDIKFIETQANKIKKMDQLSKALDVAANSNSFLDKLTGIKIGEKFLKKVGTGLSAAPTFNKILDELIVITEISIESDQLKLIKKLDDSIEQKDFDKSQQEVICEYYNLYLHHVRILLGIVIAIKIH
jgi:hypothetical protein